MRSRRRGSRRTRWARAAFSATGRSCYRGPHMKPTHEFAPELLDNTAVFRDPFFHRFRLRHAPRPLALSETVHKDYLFPTLYADVRCAIGIFHCDYQRAREILPHPAMKPVRMTRGRSLVAFSCYEYR